MRAMSAPVAERMTRMASGLKRRGRRDRRRPVGSGVGHRPGVADLGASRRALVVDGVGEAAQPGRGLGSQPDALGVGAALGGDGQVGDGGHARPARGDGPVVCDEFRGDERLGHHALEGRGLDDAVAQRDRPEPGLSERVNGWHGAVSREGRGLRQRLWGWRLVPSRQPAGHADNDASDEAGQHRHGEIPQYQPDDHTSDHADDPADDCGDDPALDWDEPNSGECGSRRDGGCCGHAFKLLG